MSGTTNPVSEAGLLGPEGRVSVGNGLVVLPLAEVSPGPIDNRFATGWVQLHRPGQVGDGLTELLQVEVRDTPRLVGPRALRVQLEGHLEVLNGILQLT